MWNRLGWFLWFSLLVPMAVLGQGRLQLRPDVQPASGTGAAIARSTPAASNGFPLRLIASTASDQDIVTTPASVDTGEVDDILTNVSVDVPADPARTYLYLCAGSAAFWQQIPSNSPLFFQGFIAVRFDNTVIGTFSDSFAFENVREFDTSTRQVNHRPTPSFCGALDEPQIEILLVDSLGFSQAQAQTLAPQVLRGSAHLTVVFHVRLQSVSQFEFGFPQLQVWGD